MGKFQKQAPYGHEWVPIVKLKTCKFDKTPKDKAIQPIDA
jgi:hypothetical protein